MNQASNGHEHHGHDHGESDSHGHDHGHDHSGHQPQGHDHGEQSLNALAFTATRHCLTGCAIGEVLGMVIGTALGWHELATVALAVGLAFLFGYSLTLIPLLRSGMSLREAAPITFAVDTISITVMEIVDNAIMLGIPGAMDSGAADPFFWIALAVALAVAFVVTLPVNRWLIQRGKGHALVHHLHSH